MLIQYFIELVRWLISLLQKADFPALYIIFSQSSKGGKSGIEGKCVCSVLSVQWASCYWVLLADIHTKTSCCGSRWCFFKFCSCTERQHLGSIPDHLSSVNTQQLASRVYALCAQIQGENLYCRRVSTPTETPAKMCLKKSGCPHFCCSLWAFTLL